MGRSLYYIYSIHHGEVGERVWEEAKRFVF